MVFKAFHRNRKVTASQTEQATSPVLEGLERRLMLSTHRHRTSTVPGEVVTGGVIRNGGSPTTGATLTQIKTTYGINQLSTYSPQYPLFDNTGNGEVIVVIGAAAAQVNDVPMGRTGNINIFSANEGISGLIGSVFVDPVGSVDQTGNSDPFGAIESTMELEWAHAMAPFAQEIFVEVPSTNGVIAPSDFESGVEEAVQDLQMNYPGPINQFLAGGVVDLGASSTGEDPTIEAQYDALFAYKYAKDVSFIAPSGDTGGIVSMPADSPYVTSVGGTVFNTLTSVGGKNPQTASLVSGGGASEFEALPSFQKGITVNGKALQTRSGPDLAMISQVQGEGVYVYYDPTLMNNAPKKTYTVEGTEVAAAIFTGAMADMNELRYSLGLSPIGRDLNNEMYALYKQNSSLYFNDITQGNNTIFQAYRHFDLVSGMGTPNLNALIPGLAGVPAVQSVTTTLNADFYQSLLGGALTGNAITPFTGFGNVQIGSNSIVFVGNLTNLSTTTSGGTTTTVTNTVTLIVPNQIVRNVGNTFATRATAQVSVNGSVFDFDIVITGRVTGSGTDEGVTGTFYTVNRYGHRINFGTYAIIQGSFRST